MNNTPQNEEEWLIATGKLKQQIDCLQGMLGNVCNQRDALKDERDALKAELARVVNHYKETMERITDVTPMIDHIISERDALHKALEEKQ